MTHFLRAKEIDPADIDLNNGAFLFSPLPPRRPDERLLTSVREFGLLMPPLLLARQPGYHQVITGWRRIAAFSELFPGRSLPCLVAGTGMKDADCLALALEDILLHRSPSSIETAIFFKKIGKFKQPEQIIATFAARLGLPREAGVIERFTGLLDLEEPLVTAIHEKLLDERLAFELTGLIMRDRLAFFNVVEQLRLSVSNQRKLLHGLRELAVRHNTSIMALLSDAQVSAILNHVSANVPQKTSMLMHWLELRLFPRLQAAEKDFRLLVKELRLPANMSLSHHAAFEKDTLTLAITCADRLELSHILDTLQTKPLPAEEAQ